MELCLLLLLPVLIGLGGLIFGKRKINWKEFLVQEAVVVMLVGAGFWIGRSSQTKDVEVWSGRVTKKAQVQVPCRHSYPCNPHDCMCSTDSNGITTCSTCWDTCYEHSFDYDWNVYDSTGTVFTIVPVDRQGLMKPQRWEDAYVGEPTASRHGFTNYIKGSPWTIIKRTGAAERFSVPAYPDRIYNYYYVSRFVSTVPIVDKRPWIDGLTEMNADLGKKKQVNIILLITDAADSAYIHALEEAWLGGKKNDFVVVIGAPHHPKIDWVRAMSWTRVEELKIAVRDRLQEVGTLDKRDEILAVIREEVGGKFVRRPMADFEYLNAEIRPPTWVLVLILLLGIATSVGLTILFYYHDPFGSTRPRWRRRRRR